MKLDECSVNNYWCLTNSGTRLQVSSGKNWEIVSARRELLVQETHETV